MIIFQLHATLCDFCVETASLNNLRSIRRTFLHKVHVRNVKDFSTVVQMQSHVYLIFFSATKYHTQCSRPLLYHLIMVQLVKKLLDFYAIFDKNLR